MKKRLSKKEKQDNFVKDVINKMFEIAGHSVTYDDISGRKDDWYTQWTITLEQNNEWNKWGVREIKKRFNLTEDRAKKEMAMVSLMWGLKFSNFDSNVGV